MHLKDLPEIIKTKEAIILDMDGTLLNSEPVHALALSEGIKELGKVISPEDIQKNFIGLCDKDVCARIFTPSENISPQLMTDKKNFHFKKIMAGMDESEARSMLTPGVEEFLIQMRMQRKKIALVTASDETQMHATIGRLAIDHLFDRMVSANKTFLSKPSASPYLYVLRKFHVSSTATIIFEDSVTGLTAAIESGSTVVRVTEDPSRPNPAFQKFKNLSAIANFYGLISNPN